MSVSTVLVATDFSAGDWRLLDVAGGLALQLQAGLDLLHVSEVTYHALGRGADLEKYVDQLMDAVRRRLDRDAEALRPAGINVRTVDRAGEPSQEIQAALLEGGAELVVVGRAHAVSRRHFVVSSTAHRLLHAARVPVLVVPLAEDDQPGGYVAANPLPKVGRVLLATDLGPHTDQELANAEGLCRQLGAELVVGHVLVTPAPIALLPGEAPIGLPQGLAEEVLEERRSHLSERVRDLVQRGLKAEARTWISHHPAVGIIELAQSCAVDLVMVSAHGKTTLQSAFLGSTTDRLAKTCPLPLWVQPRD